jgi:hypothetical protein
MDMLEATLEDIRALDKYKGFLSSDLIAHCRVLQRAMKSIPEDWRRKFREVILDRISHFGSFFSVQNHAILGPTLRALGHTF